MGNGKNAENPGIEESESLNISVVIPVYNSAPLVGKTIERTMDFLKSHIESYELILVNDGSKDRSWDILKEKALANPYIIAIDLLRNYGQHTAILCGLNESAGERVITLDDDLQNPPEEMIHLIEKAREGHDVVFGRYHEKKHPWYRRQGTRVIALINRRVFSAPKGLALTNFRILNREVVNRICHYRTNYPYISGLALMFSTNPGNAWVKHEERSIGKSGYNPIKIAKVMGSILFNYSAFPLRLASALGGAISCLSLLLGLYFLLRAIFGGISVPGWATIIVLLAFFNGIMILILSIIGEYVVRILTQSSTQQLYGIKEHIQ